MAEFLIFAGDEAPLYLEKLRDNSVFRVEPFDERAAIELAHVELASRKRGNKRGTTDGAAWQKVKFDRQIVAIAKANGATCIYSTDLEVVKHAAEFGIESKTISDLPKPPAVQDSLAFEKTEIQDVTGADQKLEPPPVDLRGSGDGHSQNPAPAAATKGEAQNKPDEGKDGGTEGRTIEGRPEPGTSETAGEAILTAAPPSPPPPSVNRGEQSTLEGSETKTSATPPPSVPPPIVQEPKSETAASEKQK